MYPSLFVRTLSHGVEAVRDLLSERTTGTLFLRCQKLADGDWSAKKQRATETRNEVSLYLRADFAKWQDSEAARCSLDLRSRMALDDETLWVQLEQIFKAVVAMSDLSPQTAGTVENISSKITATAGDIARKRAALETAADLAGHYLESASQVPDDRAPNVLALILPEQADSQLLGNTFTALTKASAALNAHPMQVAAVELGSPISVYLLAEPVVVTAIIGAVTLLFSKVLEKLIPQAKTVEEKAALKLQIELYKLQCQREYREQMRAAGFEENQQNGLAEILAQLVETKVEIRGVRARVDSVCTSAGLLPAGDLQVAGLLNEAKAVEPDEQREAEGPSPSCHDATCGAPGNDPESNDPV